MNNFCIQGIRDYIHVMDLATGHVAALAKLEKQHLNIKVCDAVVFRKYSFLFRSPWIV